MKRHEQREQIFLLLFRTEFHDTADMPDQVRLFFEDNEAVSSQKDIDYIRSRCQSVLAQLHEIDKLINDNTEGWNTSRMGKVELTVLRLAVYEMRFDDDIPVGVAIDEAVEIAKKYGQENSGAFVNAILAKIAKQGG